MVPHTCSIVYYRNLVDANNGELPSSSLVQLYTEASKRHMLTSLNAYILISSLIVQEKLIRAQNYKALKRAIEIGLSTKRKLGFLKGIVVRSHTDVNLAKLWDTCNNMMISWIMGFVSESVARSIMFIGTITKIWQQLEMRFSVSDGSRKYRLNKDTYEITQSGCSIGEYYTKMKYVWEELDSLNILPVIVDPSINRSF
ncbi:cysteine-rich receptor-like protein kinase 8 [Tanacetum coccineum]